MLEGAPAEVVEAVGSRRAAGACVGVVDTCSGLSQVGGRTFEAATPVEFGAKVRAVGTSAFEAGAAAEGPMVHCYPRSLATYAAGRYILRNGVLYRPATIAVGCTHLENRLVYDLVQ